MKKLALSIIVKDDKEAGVLDRALSSVAKQVEGIYITITNKPNKEIKKVAKRYDATVSYFKWVNSFEKARNYAFSQIPEEYEYILWIDADDVVVNAHKIPNLIEQMQANNLTSIFMDYNYDIDEDTGKVNIVHPRERIIRRGYYEWKGHLHETLIPTREANNSFFKDVYINHFPVEGADERNMIRNCKILEETYKKEGDGHDPRTEFYLARQYFDMGRFPEAIKLFVDYLEHSGWDEERAMAHNYLGLMALADKDMDTARDHFILAIREKPQFPTWYVNLAYLYALEKNYDEATHYLRLFVNTPSPKTSTVKVPIDDEMRYYRALYLVAIGKRKIKEAIDAAEEMHKRQPDNKHVKDKLESVKRLNELVEITKGVKAIGLELEKTDDDTRIQTLLNALPESIADNAYVEKLRQKYLKPKTWKKGSIVYYTGPTYEEWNPNSIKTGLGGSETAVVKLSEYWAKKGYDVTVYGNTGANEDTYNGVTYKNWYRFNQKDTFDTLILWRNPTLLDVPYKANRIFLDLHDVPNPNEYTDKRVETVDTIFVKSKYHRSLIPHVPDNKFAVIPNGVELKAKNKKGKRDPHKLIYSSSYDRGLEQMLTWGWPIIKKKVPKATLDIYYGWNLFDAAHRNNPERRQWKKKMQELMGQDGVTEYGRVGHDELIKHKSEASIHYYATDFEEIDCISVRESSLVGCIPVMTDYAALKEKPYGMTVKGNPRAKETHENIAREIVRLLKDGIPDSIRKNAIEKASEESWKGAAEKWLKILEK